MFLTSHKQGDAIWAALGEVVWALFIHITLSMGFKVIMLKNESGMQCLMNKFGHLVMDIMLSIELHNDEIPWQNYSIRFVSSVCSTLITVF